MKILKIFFSLFVICNNSFGQFLTYKVDKISIAIPSPSLDSDTLGQHIVKAQSEVAIMLIVTRINAGETEVNPKNDKDLERIYDGFAEGYIKSINGELITQENIKINEFLCNKLQAKVLLTGKNYIFECLTLFLSEKLYNIQYFYEEANSKKVEKEKKNYFSSLKILDNLKPKDQFKRSHKKVYEELTKQSYHPFKKGQKNSYATDLSKYTISSDTKITEIEKRQYIKHTTDYNGTQTIAYYREQDGNVLYIKPDQKNETVQIPKNIQVGQVWYESDSTWKYTITSISENLETPISVFKDCLVIQSQYIDKNKPNEYYKLYLQYYQRGRGYVGTKVGGLIYSYLIPNE